ncbi:hypothetical protein BH24DEI2_BH24DEI2_15750 [soil metagenome]
MPRIQHIALKTNDLERTRAFYKLLGLEGDLNTKVGRMWLKFDDGFTLIFDYSNELLHPATLNYLGLELADFEAVDRMFERLAPHISIERDLREKYREAQGPYGFFVEDPNGYTIKIFKYDDPE